MPFKEEEVVDDCSDDELWPATSSSFTADSSTKITTATSVDKTAPQNSVSATTWVRSILCSNDIVPIYRRSDNNANNGCAERGVESDSNDTMNIVNQEATPAVSVSNNDAFPMPISSSETVCSLSAANKVNKTETADSKTSASVDVGSRKRLNRDSSTADGVIENGLLF